MTLPHPNATGSAASFFVESKATLEHTPAAPTPSPGSPSGPCSLEILEIDAMERILPFQADSSTLRRYYASFASVSPKYVSNVSKSKYKHQCVVENYGIQASASKTFFKGPPALFDTNCSVASGLVFSLKFCKSRNLDLRPKPQGLKSFICRLANGVLIKPSGYVYKVCVKVDNEFINFFDVPVFPNLSYDVIFGFSSFLYNNLTIFANKGKILLRVDHFLHCDGERGQRRTENFAGTMGAPPPLLKSRPSIFPCSVKGALPPRPLLNSQCTPVTVPPLKHATIEVDTPSEGFPHSENEMSMSSNCVIEDSVVLANNENKTESLTTVFAPCSNVHELEIENKTHKGSLPPLGGAELSDGEGDGIVTIEDFFEIEAIPGGSLPCDSSSENILESSDVPPPTSSNMVPLRGDKHFVKLKHIDNHVLKSPKVPLVSNSASPMGGGFKREESVGVEKHTSTIDNRCVNKNELSFFNSQLFESKSANNVEIKKHSFDKKCPMKMGVDCKAKMTTMGSTHFGRGATVFTLPPLKLDSHTMYYMNFNEGGGIKLPPEKNPNLLILNNCQIFVNNSIEKNANTPTNFEELPVEGKSDLFGAKGMASKLNILRENTKLNFSKLTAKLPKVNKQSIFELSDKALCTVKQLKDCANHVLVQVKPNLKVLKDKVCQVVSSTCIERSVPSCPVEEGVMRSEVVANCITDTADGGSYDVVSGQRTPWVPRGTIATRGTVELMASPQISCVKEIEPILKALKCWARPGRPPDWLNQILITHVYLLAGMLVSICQILKTPERHGMIRNEATLDNMTQGLDAVVHLGEFQCSLVCVCLEECKHNTQAVGCRDVPEGKFQCNLVCVCAEECRHNTQAVGCRDVPELAPFDPGPEFKESADYEGYYTVKSPAGLILAHHHSTSKDDPAQGVSHDVETALDEVETDVNLDVGFLPAPEVPVPLVEAPPAEAPLAEAPAAPPAPVVTRAGREIRPPARYPQTVIIPADYIELIQQC